MRVRLTTTRATTIVSAGLLLLATSCGGSSDQAAAEVATLTSTDEGDPGAATEQDGEVEGDLGADEAALAFSQCMRDEGLDFPDLTLDAEGNIDLRAAFQSVDGEAEGFREARDICGDVLQQAGFGGGRREALESPEVEDALIDFSACVRDAGYDVGDLTLDGGRPDPGAQGEEGQGDDEAGAGGQEGQARNGLGNRSARFAEQLGLDPEDPDVEAAIDGCMSFVDEAFASAGVGQAPGNG